MESTMKENVQRPVAVLGFPISSLTAGDAVDTLDRLILSGGSHQVCAMNVDTWLNALADPHLHRIVAGSSLVLADGMPLVWASGLLGCPLAERVTGVDLVPRLAELSARKGYGIFLLGAKPGVADRAKTVLERMHPGVRIVGTFAPAEEDLTRMDHGEILRKIQAVRPDILLVAFGNPKQEKWIWMHRKRMGVPLSMGVGGSFDMLVGDTRRAPRWIQRSGLEWAMRFLQEPIRLGPRYLRDLTGLCRWLPQALLAAWCQRSYRGNSSVTTEATSEVLHVRLHGKLGSGIASAMQQAVNDSIRNGLVMVAHLSDVRQVTAAGMGVLLETRRQLLENGLSLLLSGLNIEMRYVLHAWQLQRLFDEWQPAMTLSCPPVPRVDGPVPVAVSGERDVASVRTRMHG
jgi:N-acetylglucosaminyldiphosphoundecaprenol N-acetyl-beta-D-mannosaminyltransferase